MEKITLLAPLSGVMLAIDEVPDPVFATRMVGDGVSLDPLSTTLLAPFAGTVTQIHAALHALMLTHASGLEVIIHIGLDTVTLKGEGFRALVSSGQAVTAGQALIEFDADAVARRARSLLTQIVIPTGDLVARLEPSRGCVRAGLDVVLVAHLRATADSRGSTEVDTDSASLVSASVRIVNLQGLHARPAAALAACARQFRSEVSVICGDRRGNAKSVTAVMALEIARDAQVSFEARGVDAQAAVNALVRLADEAFGETAQHGEAPSAAPLAAGEASPAPPRVDDPPGTFRGLSASPGQAIGRIFQLRRAAFEVSETAADAARERAVLERALGQARMALDAMRQRVADSVDTASAAIFAAHRELVDDPDLAEQVSALLARGKSAGFAWRRACDDLAESLAALSNPLLAQRAIDVRDVRDRVLRIITGGGDGPFALPDQCILIAEDLTPTDTATLDRSRVLGFATLHGGPTSHVAILARSLDLPAVVAIDPGARGLSDGSLVALDGSAGTLRVDPSEDEVSRVRATIAEQQARREAARSRAAEPARMRDGRSIEVAANIGTVEEAAPAVNSGAEGVGLLRSEVFFMGRDAAPSEDEQAEAYRAVAAALGKERRLVIRTLDVGGDKPLPYLPVGAEENPFLGERGLRLCLNRPELLRTQLRAILRAADLAAVHVMLPMVTDVDELRRARAIFEEERASLGVPPVPLGIMIEVPAAALNADALAREADFFSVGTNDLTQYALAVDRGHPRIASMADALHPAVLRLIKMAADAAHRHGRWIGVCGGVAGDPKAVPILIGLGVDELSVAVPSIPAIKDVVRGLALEGCARVAEQALVAESAAAVRALAVDSVATGSEEVR